MKTKLDPTPAQAEVFLSKIDHCTCSRWLHVDEIVGQHIIIYHLSHSEYCGRFSGSKNCEAYRAVFRYEENPKDNVGILRPLEKVVGRYNKDKRQLLLNAIRRFTFADFMEGCGARLYKDSEKKAKELKVYTCNLDGQNCGLVAAVSKADALRAYNKHTRLSGHHFSEYGNTTGNVTDIAIAMQEPGVVFSRSLNDFSDDISKAVRMTTLAERFKNRRIL